MDAPVFARMKTGQLRALDRSEGRTSLDVAARLAADHGSKALTGAANFMDDATLRTADGGTIVWADVAELIDS